MIDFSNVSITYPNGTNALHNVTLHIDKGEFVFIVGASGAGKSTFLKLIMREEIPTSGEITINGNKLSGLKKRHVPYLRRHMGIVFQDFRLIDKMNVFNNVAFAMRAVGESTAVINKRVPYVLDLVGLGEKMKDKPSELSGGEQQRVSLARALVNNPEIIIADEPTGNVDPEMSHEILELLMNINAMGTTVLVVTHEHELVREFNRRVITLDLGEVISDTGAVPGSAADAAAAEEIDLFSDESIAISEERFNRDKAGSGPEEEAAPEPEKEVAPEPEEEAAPEPEEVEIFPEPKEEAEPEPEEVEIFPEPKEDAEPEPDEAEIFPEPKAKPAPKAEKPAPKAEKSAPAAKTKRRWKSRKAARAGESSAGRERKGSGYVGQHFAPDDDAS